MDLSVFQEALVDTPHTPLWYEGLRGGFFKAKPYHAGKLLVLYQSEGGGALVGLLHHTLSIGEFPFGSPQMTSVPKDFDLFPPFLEDYPPLAMPFPILIVAFSPPILGSTSPHLLQAIDPATPEPKPLGPIEGCETVFWGRLEAKDGTLYGFVDLRFHKDHQGALIFVSNGKDWIGNASHYGFKGIVNQNEYLIEDGLCLGEDDEGPVSFFTVFQIRERIGEETKELLQYVKTMEYKE